MPITPTQAKADALQNLISKAEEKTLQEIESRMQRLHQPVSVQPALDPPFLKAKFNCPGKQWAPSYFQVKRSHEDDMFLRRIDECEIPWSEKYNYSMETLVQNEVAWKVFNEPAILKLCHTFKQMPSHPDVSKVYRSFIIAAATVVHSFDTIEALFKLASYEEHQKQLTKLSREIGRLRIMAKTVHEFCSLVVLHKIDEKYSFVTDGDLTHFLSLFIDGLMYPELRRRGYKGFSPPREKDSIYYEILEVVREMKLPQRSKVDNDNYTRLLIHFASGSSSKQENDLLKHVMEIVDSEALARLDHTYEHLKFKLEGSLLNMILLDKVEIIYRIDTAVGPMRELVKNRTAVCPVCDLAEKYLPGNEFIHGVHFICNDVYEIIEVAELRRVALGSRFISRNHFLWAFYELGFGLPPKIRETWKFDDEDCPPYHIYLAAIKLADSFKEKIMHLECFVFAVLFMQELEELVITDEMQEHFQQFLEVLALDGVTRPSINAESWLNVLEF